MLGSKPPSRPPPPPKQASNGEPNTSRQMSRKAWSRMRIMITASGEFLVTALTKWNRAGIGGAVYKVEMSQANKLVYVFILIELEGHSEQRVFHTTGPPLGKEGT